MGEIVVTARPYDHMQVIHRIVAIFDEGVLTQGDANPVDDGLLLAEDNITGVYLAHIPGVGYIANIIRTPVGIGIILTIVVLLLISDARSSSRRKQDGNNVPDSR